MNVSWKTALGNLICRWSELGQRVQYRPRWMEETSEIQSGYLAPTTDFASHSPLGGGTSWFQLHIAQRAPK